VKNQAVASRQRNILHFLFHWGFFNQKHVTVIPNPLYFSLLLRLKIKLKVRHFNTVEVIEAELQAVLNTFTEHDFQDAFKKR
jgi:hypothetical protein